MSTRQALNRESFGRNSTRCGKHVRHLMFEFCDRACLHSSWVGDDIAVPGSVASAAKSIGPTHCHPQPLEPPLIILVGPRLSIWLAGWRVWCLAGGLIKDSGLLGCLARCSSAEQRVRHSRARQIGLSVRLRVLWCARLTYTSDWVRRSARLIRVPDCQIGCCARLARLALAPDCQIGALVRLGLFLFRPPAERLGALLNQGARLSSTPDCQRHWFIRFSTVFQIDQIGLGFRLPGWIRLRSVPDCQIGPARLTPD